MEFLYVDKGVYACVTRTGTAEVAFVGFKDLKFSGDDLFVYDTNGSSGDSSGTISIDYRVDEVVAVFTPTTPFTSGQSLVVSLQSDAEVDDGTGFQRYGQDVDYYVEMP